MRAQWFRFVIALGLIGGIDLQAKESAGPESAQVSSCPTVLPAAEGERSVVVPSIAPHMEPQSVTVQPVAPHTATQLRADERDSARSLLKQKLAERDQLQREIAALRTATNTPSQISVKVKVLEINQTKLRELGLGAPALNYQELDGATLAKFDELVKRNLGRVLAEPTVVTTDGQSSSMSVGGEFPVPQPGEDGGVTIHKYGTQLDVTATALGDNRVRFSVRPRVSEIDAARSVEVAGQKIPALTVRECDLSGETVFGKSVSISGLVQQRNVSSTNWLGRKSDVAEEIALVIVVTPELVR